MVVMIIPERIISAAVHTQSRSTLNEGLITGMGLVGFIPLIMNQSWD